MMRWSTSMTAIGAVIAALCAGSVAAAPPARARLVILVVWDGLRPDSVNATVTPNLYALENQGVTFADHHAVYPTATMVNAAALSTGQPPGATGIWGNSVYLAPFAPPAANSGGRPAPAYLEDSTRLAMLNGKGTLDGHLMGANSIAAQLVRGGGWFAALGKQGPTFLFDDRAVTDGAILISDDDVLPHPIYRQFGLDHYPASLTMAQWQTPPFAGRDTYFAQVAAEHLLPAAAPALARGRNAWLVVWLHNPDAAEYVAGLGTAEGSAALANCDAALGRLRRAVARLGLNGQTDLMVISDHGLATLKARVPLIRLLTARRLVPSPTGTEPIVIADGGSDGIFIAPGMASGARHALLRKIVAYAASQPWCGPIFSRPRPGARSGDYRGDIPGTFNQAYFGLRGPRSPDLVISFRELDGEDNRTLTGPGARAVVLEATGPATVPNRSQFALKPAAGVAYADVPPGATTGMAIGGALGAYELKAFGAAAGPDFRAGFVDRAPTSNLDVAWTVSRLLGLPPPGGKAAGGRVMNEALAGGTSARAPQPETLRTTLRLAGERVTMTIAARRLDGELYLDGAQVERHITRAQPAMTAR